MREFFVFKDQQASPEIHGGPHYWQVYERKFINPFIWESKDHRGGIRLLEITKENEFILDLIKPKEIV